MFNPSLVRKLDYAPFQTDAQGAVTQALAGVFLLLSRELVDMMKAELTAAQKAELESFVYPLTEDQAATWNVPIWARAPGEPAPDPAAVYIRVPAAVWASPDAPVPQKVKTLLAKLWREVS